MQIVPRITDSCAHSLLESALGVHDVLGYRDFGGPTDDAEDGDAEQVTESDQTAFIAELAADALTGRQTGVLERLLRNRTQDRMDLVTATLLIHMGLVPAAALELRRTLVDCNRTLDVMDDADDGDGPVLLSGDKDGWDIDLDRDRDTSWSSSRGLVNVPRLPQVLSVAGAARPLSDILSHPALDRLDLVIDRIETDDRGTRIHLRGYGEGQQGGVTLDASGLERMRRAALPKAA